MHKHMLIHIHIYMYILMHMHVDIYIYIYIYTYSNACVQVATSTEETTCMPHMRALHMNAREFTYMHMSVDGPRHLVLFTPV